MSLASVSLVEIAYIFPKCLCVHPSPIASSLFELPSLYEFELIDLLSEKERLYAKDVPCPIQWLDFLCAGNCPPHLLPQGQNDYMIVKSYS
jgi:hypothetical protein